MMTSSNGNIFRVTGPLCAEFTGPGDFPTQRPVTRSFDIFFDLRLNKRLSKQPWGWWFETLSWSLWRHYNDFTILVATKYVPQVNSVTFTIRTNTIRQWIKTGQVTLTSGNSDTGSHKGVSEHNKYFDTVVFVQMRDRYPGDQTIRVQRNPHTWKDPLAGG